MWSGLRCFRSNCRNGAGGSTSNGGRERRMSAGLQLLNPSIKNNHVPFSDIFDTFDTNYLWVGRTFPACPKTEISAVPSGLAETKSQCDLTAYIEITEGYKLAGHTPCGARPARTDVHNYSRTDWECPPYPINQRKRPQKNDIKDLTTF